ncbi:Gldg family protein [Planktothrix sp. FACHB-1355]|uniref:Gldg family protein n=1 Tax=Aerosakkonema funiforme FACHB-1375 TaxID=2949571 RepID=A0A926VDD5_9CYAN|nr:MULTISPECIES: Gldg family protein [Oscillatoriales]MBD2181801.1 Gldg family protein [Aerosakkonema funiforme FACHB-1375]MBD3559505.1 Gldg family protein [Planktothrix sp. FACHB-1355]
MKTFKFSDKYAKYLLWIGLFLLAAGFTAWVVSDKWLPVPLLLVICGSVALGLWLASQGNGDLTSPTQSFWGQRSTQAGTNAFVATAAVVAILVVINFLGVRYSGRMDLSENQQFTLSPQSQQLVRDLTQPVKVWIFDRNPDPKDKQLLENYQRQGSKFSFEYIDPNVNPGLARKFNLKESGEAYLEYGEQRKFIQNVNQNEPLSEEKLTNAIEQIKSDRTLAVYFLQGHGERPMESVRDGLSQAMKYLEQKNYKSIALNLAERSSVPDDAVAVVVAGPKRALFEQEVKVLREYLDRGGSLLLALDPNTDLGLNSLLDEWGVKLENRLAVDASDDGRLIGLGPATPIVTNYGNHPITKNFGNGISFYQMARPLDIQPIKGVEATPLLLTSQDSWAESDLENRELTFDPKQDRQGPLILGVALSRKAEFISNSQPAQASPSPAASPNKSESQTSKQNLDKKPKKRSDEARLVVFGNSSFVSDGVFEQQLNGDVFLNSVSWLNRQENRTLSIRPKQPNQRRLKMRLSQAGLLTWISIVILPLIGFGTAGWLWWRRR